MPKRGLGLASTLVSLSTSQLGLMFPAKDIWLSMFLMDPSKFSSFP